MAKRNTTNKQQTQADPAPKIPAPLSAADLAAQVERLAVLSQQLDACLAKPPGGPPRDNDR